MTAIKPISILPFVPAYDFKASSQYYLDLGFRTDNAEEVRFFGLGKFGFLLQDHYVEDWAGNFMMAMHVENVDEWYLHVQKSGVVDKYEDATAYEPKLEDWGMIVMHMTDPTGVLWHITQSPSKS